MIFLLFSIAFANPEYEVNAGLLPNTGLGAGDTLHIYGDIDHSGKGAVNVDDFKIKIYKSTDPDSYEWVEEIDYQSDYSNSGDLLLDGVFHAEAELEGMTKATYNVQIIIDDEVRRIISFEYNKFERNVTLSINEWYRTTGGINVNYVIENKGENNDTYTLVFESPRSEAQETVSIGEVENGTEQVGSYVIRDSGDFLAYESNIFVARVTGTSGDESLPYVSIETSNLDELEIDASVSFLDDCSAKERETTTCSFKVENNGDYPLDFDVIADSSLNTEIDYDSSSLNHSDARTGIVSITAEEGDKGNEPLTLKLMNEDSVVDTDSQDINVLEGDPVTNVTITNMDITPSRDIMEGDEVKISFDIENSGDNPEYVDMRYGIGDRGEEVRNMGLLDSSEKESKNIEFTATESVTVEIKLEDSSGRLFDTFSQTIYVEPYKYEPYIRWHSSHKYLIQGENKTNTLTMRNNGNVEDYYKIIINSPYAALSKRVRLSAGNEKEITIPVITQESTKTGEHSINATVCSLAGNNCESDVFKLHVLELIIENSSVSIDESVQVLDELEGAVYEISVENNEGETHTYKAVIGDVEGEVEISPKQLTLLDKEEGTFFVYIKPETRKDMNVSYNVIKEDEIIKEGNLTITTSANRQGVTGLITLNNLRNAGFLVIGTVIIIGLLITGSRLLNQSTSELKYWK